MPHNITNSISETECIGDSLNTKINPNFLKLDEAVQSLSASLSANTQNLSANIQNLSANKNTFSGSVTISGSLGIGTTTPVFSAVLLELSSTSQGFLPPRMTAAQRATIGVTSALSGLIIYNTTTSRINYYTGTTWLAITGVAVA
jgi:hypothetical protein